MPDYLKQHIAPCVFFTRFERHLSTWLTLALTMLMLLLTNSVQAAFKVPSGDFDQAVGFSLSYVEDPSRTLTIDSIQQQSTQQRFQAVPEFTPNFSFTQSSYWLRLEIDWSQADRSKYFLWQRFPTTDFITFYVPDDNGNYIASHTGDQLPFTSRQVNTSIFGVKLEPLQGKNSVIYIEGKGDGTLVFDLSISTADGAISSIGLRHLIFGLFFGGIVAITLYNLVLFYSLRDSAYGYYCLYMIGLGLTFFTLNGLSFTYFWPHFHPMNTWFLLFSYLGLLSLLLFTRSFLQLPINMPRFDKVILFLCLSCMLGMLSIFTIPTQYIYSLSQLITLTIALITFFAGVHLLRKGHKSSRYFVLATGWYIVGIFLYPLHNFGLIESSFITKYAVQIGASIEMILLSFALADRVNIMRQEKLQAEQSARLQLQEANRMLEIRVSERTQELSQSMHALEQKHQALITTQEQLVQAEKMSSLGGLVAGIAHEINNPANFTQLSAENLERDLDRLKAFLLSLTDNDSDPALIQELQARFEKININTSLMKEGTQRLTQIVNDLRQFSRLNESDRKLAKPDDGLKATLNLVRAQYYDYVDIQYEGHDEDTESECFPASLNQVFMNLAVNACQAVTEKALRLKADGTDIEKGLLSVVTRQIYKDNKPYWEAHFIDTGIGIDTDIKNRIFEPFFTTKPVGDGSGLGLSIAYGIIQKHHGELTVESTPEQGSHFTLCIPILNPITTATL